MSKATLARRCILPVHSLFILLLWTSSSNAQSSQSNRPQRVTLCELAEHPEEYAGKIVEVQAHLMGADLWIEEFSPSKGCSAYMRVFLELPQNVKPAPAFALVRDDSYKSLFDAFYGRMNVEAVFEGRFDPLFTWRNKKRVRIGQGQEKGYGKKQEYDGRIVWSRVSEVRALQVPRK